MSAANRLAIIIERVDVALGGAERSVNELVQALRRQGLEVDLLAASGTAFEPQTHILCPQSSGQRVSFDSFSIALQEHLRTESYDWVHSVLPFAFADVYQPRGGTYAETQRRHIASHRSPFTRAFKKATAFTNRRRARLLSAERRLVKASDGPHIAALSHYVARQFVEHYQCPAHRITVIRNGVEPPPCAAPGESRPTDKATTLLFAANNFRLKGLASCIQALALAQKEGIALELQVAGSGCPQHYQAWAARLGVRPSIRFLGPLKNIASALQACDVAVLPTFYDPASRFILEALTCGKPVITTRFNGAIDHFTGDRHGFLLDSPNHIRALADAMIKMSNPATRKSMSEAIRQDHLASHIHIDRAARELIKLYQSLSRRKGT